MYKRQSCGTAPGCGTTTDDGTGLCPLHVCAHLIMLCSMCVGECATAVVTPPGCGGVGAVARCANTAVVVWGLHCFVSSPSLWRCRWLCSPLWLWL